MIRVVKPGMLLTIQDLGRHGYAHWGISPSGAADALALRAGNRLLANPDNTPAIEMTMLGPTFEFTDEHVIAVTGGDADLRLSELCLSEVAGGEAHMRPVWSSFAVRAGQQLRISHLKRGARLYLCVAGGIRVGRVLGSAAGSPNIGIGPPVLTKHTLLKAPQVSGVRLRRLLPAIHLDAYRQAAMLGHATLRVTAGPQLEEFAEGAAQKLENELFTVADDSDRFGIRLHGPPIDSPYEGQMPTQGIPFGALQIPPSGQPIILGVDAQTTGGYPVLASVIAADAWRLGQLRPRDTLRFLFVTLEEAYRLLDVERQWLDSIRVEVKQLAAI